MDSTSNKNKQIAKNTIFLYLRMILLMLVSLYTSRVILSSLGIEDYGIFNVVGGAVAMFSMISASLSSAVSRFITYELGRGTTENLNKVFSSSVTIQILLALFIIVIAESFGLWFINNKLVIPEGRLLAAHWCFQFSIITFSINLISVPYNASIIAHEKMSAFAYISILEGLGQLAIAFLVAYNPFDRLIYYGMMLCILATSIRFIYGHYCKIHFDECHYVPAFDKTLLKKMFGFAGWNMIGTCSAVLRDQGNILLINMFFGPVVNSAQAVATKVNTAVSSFVQNFMVALNPQITKSYASGNKDYMFNLAFQGSRLSFYMLLFLSLPIIMNTPFIMNLWLEEVPEYTVVFVQLILILALCESLSHTLVTTILADGNIKKYMIVVGGLQLMNLPLNIVFLKLGVPSYIIYLVAIGISQICLVARLWILREMMSLQIRTFLKNVYFNVLIVALISCLLPVFVNLIIEEGWINFLLVSAASVLSVVFTEFFIGCNRQERAFVINKVRSFNMFHK